MNGTAHSETDPEAVARGADTWGLGDGSPQRGPDAEPLVGVRGKAAAQNGGLETEPPEA